MIVTCPQCETSFSVPDDVYRPGRKARCSHCSHVFRMPDLPQEPSSSQEPTTEMKVPSPSLSVSPPPKPVKKKWKKIAIITAIVALCLAGVSAGFVMVYKAYQASKQEELAKIIKARRLAREQEAAVRQEQDKAVNSITLIDVRQTVVNNEKLGPLVVIEGFARNDFSTPRENIAIEARLLDEAGTTIVKSQQLCGVSLNLTQLEVLDVKELSQAMNNPLDILANNSNVQPGQKVAFIALFQGVPDNFYSYEVRPISALTPGAAPPAAPAAPPAAPAASPAAPAASPAAPAASPAAPAALPAAPAHQ